MRWAALVALAAISADCRISGIAGDADADAAAVAGAALLPQSSPVPIGRMERYVRMRMAKPGTAIAAHGAAVGSDDLEIMRPSTVALIQQHLHEHERAMDNMTSLLDFQPAKALPLEMTEKLAQLQTDRPDLSTTGLFKALGTSESGLLDGEGPSGARSTLQKAAQKNAVRSWRWRVVLLAAAVMVVMLVVMVVIGAGAGAALTSAATRCPYLLYVGHRFHTSTSRRKLTRKWTTK